MLPLSQPMQKPGVLQMYGSKRSLCRPSFPSDCHSVVRRPCLHGAAIPVFRFVVWVVFVGGDGRHICIRDAD
jgi:hypothetical protein